MRLYGVYILMCKCIVLLWFKGKIHLVLSGCLIIVLLSKINVVN